MNKEKYLAKIKKLMNLARKTTNPNEAASAIRQAQNLMQRHNLSRDAVEFSDISEATTKGAPSDANDPPKYMGYLTQIIAEAFGVKAYFTRRYSGLRGIPKRCITFYGPDTRPQIAAYAFDVMSRQMVAARREYIGTMRKNVKPSTKTSRADTFCENWALGAYQVLELFTVSEAEETLITAYQAKLKQGGLGTAPLRDAGKCRGAGDAANAGYRSGLNAKISHGVNGSQAAVPLMLGGGPQ